MGTDSIRHRTVSLLPLHVKRRLRLNDKAAHLFNLFPGFRNAVRRHPFMGRKPGGASAIK
jgi:hypothetical protein